MLIHGAMRKRHARAAYIAYTWQRSATYAQLQYTGTGHYNQHACTLDLHTKLISLSDYLRNFRLWKYGEQLFQVICLAVEDVNTRNNQSFAF